MIMRSPAFPSQLPLLVPLLALALGGATLAGAQELTPPNAAAASTPAAPAEKREGALPADAPRELAIDQALARKLPEVKFDGVGLSDVIDFLRDVTGTNVFVNYKALEAAGIDKNAPVTARLFNVKFSKALQVILDSVSTEKARAGYSVEDGVINISTVDVLNKNVITRVYDVRDLIADVPDCEPKEAAAPATQPGEPATKPVERSREQRGDEVIKLIEETMAPDTWKGSGGSVGAIRQLSGQLVITQTRDNHAMIAQVLDQLRESQMIQITVEARFISCDQQLYRALLADWHQSSIAAAEPALNGEVPTTPPASPGFLLTDAQVSQLLRAAQDPADSALLAAPRLTFRNGQRACVQVTCPRSYVRDYATVTMPGGQARYEPIRASVDPGLVMDVQGTASADRKFATLTMRPKVSALLDIKQTPWPSRPAGSTLVVDEPRIRSTELQTTVNVPDHGNLLLGGMEDPGIGTAMDLPAATQLARKARLLFLLVKPSLIVQRPSN